MRSPERVPIAKMKERLRLKKSIFETKKEFQIHFADFMGPRPVEQNMVSYNRYLPMKKKQLKAINLGESQSRRSLNLINTLSSNSNK